MSCSYQTVKRVWWYVHSFRYNSWVIVMNRQMDGISVIILRAACTECWHVIMYFTVCKRNFNLWEMSHSKNWTFANSKWQPKIVFLAISQHTVCKTYVMWRWKITARRKSHDLKYKFWTLTIANRCHFENGYIIQYIGWHKLDVIYDI